MRGKQKPRLVFWLILFLWLPALPAFAAEMLTTVKWVADGDTIILKDGRHVRYIGIDAPEIDHQKPRKTPMGTRARSVNQQLVGPFSLKLVYDKETKDHYGRTLAYVYRNDGLFVNLEMVKTGNAWCLYLSPNLSHTEAFLDAQREAMNQGLGIWQTIGRDQKASVPCTGNSRSRRFHSPACPDGKKISKKNQVVFTRQWDAFWEGFSPHRKCVAFP
ncbi:thermonuclease family protein [Desulfosarcina sp. OttesenSCG-928-G10]|nr:thermonuclease family protein [Desulfosarcina sp. OttesenSCG-928-G10]